MKTRTPLFGREPTHSSLNQVETVCVKGYPESATRPPIWEGFGQAHGRIVEARTPGELWVGGEFVVDEEDPDTAQVHLRVPAGVPFDDDLADVVNWVNDRGTSDRLGCDLTAIVEIPDDDPWAHLVREFAESVLDAFTSHGESGRKGFAILPLFPPPP